MASLLEIHKSCTVHSLLYGSETWTLTRRSDILLMRAQRRMLRMMAVHSRMMMRR